ncbi:ependymin-like 1 [Osmerus eperlanus]|uniref:ependymin-like 1 n=1 Tax=Osmerus eperlanus TaxID=29151 RepID=UPI002E0EC8EF
MKTIVLFSSLVLGCLAQKPHPCKSPPLLTGSLSVVAHHDLTAGAKYTYDAFGQRIRFREIGSYQNQTFWIDALLLFREGVIYKINHQNRTCKKEKLWADFHPMEVPNNATLLGQVILGGSSGPGEGLLVNSWYGEMKRGKYVSTVTEFGCLPVSTLFHTERTGWILTSFFNILIGIEDPQDFFPPDFCQDAVSDNKGEPADFYSLFFE